MKQYLLIILLITSSIMVYAQQPQFQTYSAILQITATKGNDSEQWQNKDIVVTLNYKTGDFKAIINNYDFYNKLTNSSISRDSISKNEFVLKGIMPINKIIDQKSVNQNYDIELELINEEMYLNQTINFKMDIMRPNQKAGGYRVFTLAGILYNHELNLPAFTGYNNKIEMRIMFNGSWTGN